MGYEGFTSHTEEQIQDLARQWTHTRAADAEDPCRTLSRIMSHQSQVPGNSPFDSDDARLDPNSDQFNSRFWVKNIRKLFESDREYYKPAGLGVAYKNLRATGQTAESDFQATFLNVAAKRAMNLVRKLDKNYKKATQFDILKPMDGIARPGELTVVLGRPGAGCSTFLKTIATQTYGFDVAPESIISYDGLTPHDISHKFRGDVVYCAETETHFPHLTVGDTLEFVAKLRTPKNRPPGISRETYSQHMAEVAMATFGLSHTKNTKVGNEYIRGVSGGERKRVSIAEVYLSQASLFCWDNSTRGLDSATALEFVRALKTSATVCETTGLVAIYQCSQDVYDLFNNVVLLYEGYQIYSGSARNAKQYFVDMGWHCPQRQTTADFLTSLTNPSQREPRYGFEDKVPRSAQEFYERWQSSPQRKNLLNEIDTYLEDHKTLQEKSAAFEEHHQATQTSRTPKKSPYTVSFDMQVKYLVQRNILRTKGDPSVPLFMVVCNVIVSVLIATLFKRIPDNTGGFYHKTSVLFFATLFNAFCSLLEVFALYEARPVVEKHKKFALYRPSAEAIASIITELPTKFLVSVGFNFILYFVVGLRRNAGHFFFYWLIGFTSTLTMSHVFRTIGAATKSLQEAMTPSSILLFTLVVFTGFVIPPTSMHGWCRWINYIDPIAYAFESLIANEFHGRDFPCSVTVPRGPGYPTSGSSVVCSQVGAKPGKSTVNGDDYIGLSFEYFNSHKWRNWGILIGYTLFFLGVYLFLVEINEGAMQKGEILVFQRSALKKEKKHAQDIENGTHERFDESSDASEKKKLSQLDSTSTVDGQEPEIFHWRKLRYEVQIKSEHRLILDNVDGWVKPGQVTALMGASGAGKTTLLNALSERLTSGKITDGQRLVNGKPLDSSFQRSIGYVQQQDLHLETSTVREALKFSAYLRQPAHVSKKEKDEYVEYIIELLEMQRYADAVVGVPGEGLNVEQRKRLTIGVELVAKPPLLIFLDEPTSGLDSETAWSICKLIRKLADHGQAILCTIHQPSALLMKEFDRLLFLQKGGQTVYFGDLGKSCQKLIDYFERNGAHKCPDDANPVEWMLEVIGAAPGSHASQDYHQVWLNSEEYQQTQRELDRMEKELSKLPAPTDPGRHKAYAASYIKQYLLVTKRVFEQCWRTPSYTCSKAVLAVATALFNGFAFFKADKTLGGLQNQMFSVFMFLIVFLTLSYQYLPHFCAQRSLYEARERPSKTFSWLAFIFAQITGEIPWNIACGTVAFLCWYYPIGFASSYKSSEVAERGATMWFSIVLFYIYSSSMAQLCISFIEVSENAANLAIFLFTACLNFSGVLVAKDKIPRFWIFMYRFNPFTYLISAILSNALAHSRVECSATELVQIDPPANMTCSSYMSPYMSKAGGYLVETGGLCRYCSASTTDMFLASINADYNKRWRDLGVFIAFIAFNMILTTFFYWLARVPKKVRRN